MTCILIEAIFLPSLTTDAGNCLRPSMNGGVFNLTPVLFSISLMVNPLSAATIDMPGLSSIQFNSTSPDTRVNSTSDIDHIYSGEINDT